MCLTTQLSLAEHPDPVALHRHLRRRNPAPYACLIRYGAEAIVGYANALMSYFSYSLTCALPPSGRSSPEKFLSVSVDGHVQSKPIKGTRKRGCAGCSELT